jgi:hypothetical protein
MTGLVAATDVGATSVSSKVKAQQRRFPLCVYNHESLTRVETDRVGRGADDEGSEAEAFRKVF